MQSSSSIGILQTVRQWWRPLAAREGRLAATWALVSGLWQFMRDSTPARLRQRYGDIDYDWEHRVNTTSAAVGWRDRLLGIFHSPYQPTEQELFREILNDLQQQTKLDFKDFTFIDLGSGKGRTLLMASEYPFRRIVGVELLPNLHQIAANNLECYKNDSQKCFSLQSICEDATTWPLPDEPVVIYLFNPFPEPGLRKVIANLEDSLGAHPRPVYVLYHNPVLEHLLSGSRMLHKIGGTDQYSMFTN
jgi:SAM-dependent methyltransferase